jgi:hypothetical protein
MLAFFNGLRLDHHPTLLFHSHGDQPVSSFRRSVTSTVRSSGSGESDKVFESCVEELDGSGHKRVIVERGMGHKAMKLTQVTDGSGSTTEERVFTNVSKEEESLFDDANWLQAVAKHKRPAISDQTPVNALPASTAADSSHNIPSDTTASTLKAADAVSTPAEQEVDEHGVPVTGSFDAADDGSFHAADSATNSDPAANVAKPNEKSSNQQVQQKQQGQQKQQEQQKQEEQHSKRLSRRYNALDMDPFSRQLQSLRRLSRAFDPFDAWPLTSYHLPHSCAFAPVYDPFATSVFRRPLLDVWG